MQVLQHGSYALSRSLSRADRQTDRQIRTQARTHAGTQNPRWQSGTYPPLRCYDIRIRIRICYRLAQLSAVSSPRLQAEQVRARFVVFYRTFVCSKIHTHTRLRKMLAGNSDHLDTAYAHRYVVRDVSGGHSLSVTQARPPPSSLHTPRWRLSLLETRDETRCRRDDSHGCISLSE